MIDRAVRVARLFYEPVGEDQVLFGNDCGRDLLELKYELADRVATLEEENLRFTF